MTFEVETGTGSPTSNSYVSIQEADEYFFMKQNLDWVCLEPEYKEIYLQNGTAAVDAKYGTAYRGFILTTTQALLFPRTTFIDAYGRLVEAGTIPKALKNAVLEMSFLSWTGVDLYVSTTDTNVKSKSESVGSLSESTTWFGPTTIAVEYKPAFTQISSILVGSGGYGQGGGQRQLVRG
jgi:hypothetical protein